MIRNLKVLLAAAMALAAFGAVSAAAAHAAEEFHCQATVAPCTITANQDGAAGSVTGSQVFIIKNAAGESAAFKCGTVSGSATSSSSTTQELTVGITGGPLAYGSCKLNGSTPVTVDTNGCAFLFTSPGGGAAPGAVVHVECPVTKHIQITIPELGCTYEVTPQTVTGAFYHNIGAGATTEVTVEAKISGIQVEIGAEPCPVKGPGLTATYNGNALATAEKDNSNKEMVEGWWNNHQLTIHN